MAPCVCPLPTPIIQAIEIPNNNSNDHSYHPLCTSPPELERDHQVYDHLQVETSTSDGSSFIQTPSSDSDEFPLPFYNPNHHFTDAGFDQLPSDGGGGGGDKAEKQDDASLEELDRALEKALDSGYDTHSSSDGEGDEWENGYDQVSVRGRRPRQMEGQEVKGGWFGAINESNDLIYDGKHDRTTISMEANITGDRPMGLDFPLHSYSQTHTRYTKTDRHRSATPRISSSRRSRAMGSIPETRTRTSSAQTIRATPVKREPVIDVYTAGAKELIEALESGRATNVQIVEDYLNQIERYNGILKAVTHLAPRGDVLRLARACDKQRAFGLVDSKKKVLHGLPVLIKDNIATDDLLGMPTTAGSFAFLGTPVKKDAFVVKKLREAGAIIIGKANMSELASYKSANAPDGWSAVGGQTINVYAPHASPGTSSSGNGVALAAGFCALSVATETDGSITLPCLQSCVYGLKPTVGLLSRSGAVPFAITFDTPGPMAKDVWSVAVMLDVMQGVDPEDPVTMAVERIPAVVKYVDSCQAPTFQGLRIGVPRKNFTDIDPWCRPGRDVLSPEVSDAFELALRKMAALGATITDPAEIPSAVDGSLWRCLFGSRSKIVAADCNEHLTRYMQNLGGEGGCRSVEDIIRFNDAHPELEMPPGYRGQEVLERCLTAILTTSDEYLAAKEEMQLVAGKNGLDAVMDDNDLDAIICIREGCHSLGNMVGAPIAAVPLGLLSDNTPIGVYFIGHRGGERTLIRIMAAWEAALGERPLPPIAYAQ